MIGTPGTVAQKLMKLLVDVRLADCPAVGVSWPVFANPVAITELSRVREVCKSLEVAALLDAAEVVAAAAADDVVELLPDAPLEPDWEPEPVEPDLVPVLLEPELLPALVPVLLEPALFPDLVPELPAAFPVLALLFPAAAVDEAAPAVEVRVTVTVVGAAQLAAGALAALLLLPLKSKVRGKACAVKEESVRDKRATERALVNMMALI